MNTHLLIFKKYKTLVAELFKNFHKQDVKIVNFCEFWTVLLFLAFSHIWIFLAFFSFLPFLVTFSHFQLLVTFGHFLTVLAIFGY